MVTGATEGVTVKKCEKVDIVQAFERRQYPLIDSVRGGGGLRPP